MLASIAAALICAGGNALNDFFDIESDRISHPGRPLIGGTVPSYLAIMVWIVANLAAVVISIFLHPIQLIIAVSAIIILVWYNVWLKRTVIWGNLAVAILGGAVFIFGGLCNPQLSLKFPGALIPSLFAFLFHLGRELIKDIADYEGDKSQHIRTLPAVISPLGSLILASFISTALIVLTVYPIWQKWYNPAYGLIVVFLADIPLIGFLAFSWFAQRLDRFALTATAMKVMMVLGMAAFLFGRK